MAHGAFPSYQSDLFGPPVVPIAEAYDVWFRVKVLPLASPSGALTLGLWDDTAQRWLSASTYKPIQADSDYRWIEVARGVVPTPGHDIEFIASFVDLGGASWFVDEAAMVPATAPPTQPTT